MLLVMVLLTCKSMPWSIWHDKPIVTTEGIELQENIIRSREKVVFNEFLQNCYQIPKGGYRQSIQILP